MLHLGCWGWGGQKHRGLWHSFLATAGTSPPFAAARRIELMCLDCLRLFMKRRDSVGLPCSHVYTCA